MPSLTDCCRHVAPGRAVLACLGLAVLVAAPAGADTPVSYNLYGAPGLIDMPTAQSAPDAEFATTVSHFAGSTRTTLSFQITPRLSGSFRYARIDDFDLGTGEASFDRSFDLRYRLLDEGRYSPAIAVGLRDFVGTGLYSGEYLVATKHVTPRLAFTGGIGWGRLGSYKGFDNPLGALDSRFDTRPSGFTGTGGEIEDSKWFRGDAALFGGVAWAATDRLTLKAEYSSDNYDLERSAGRDLFDRRSPFNFGIDYKVSEGVRAQAFYLYGSELGVALNFVLNPRKPAVNGTGAPGPLPVQVRSPGSAADLGWTAQKDGPKILRDNVQKLLAAESLGLEAMDLDPRAVTIHIRNNRTLANAEAIGRTARILSRVMPASVERFTIVPVARGLPAAAVTIKRSDLERLEFAPEGAWQSYVRAEFTDAAGSTAGSVYREGLYPKFRWSLGPYLSTSYFDPDSPVRADLGVELNAAYDIAPGLTLEGAVRQRLGGNRDDATRVSDSVIQHVRSDANIYAREGETALTHLTLDYRFRPGTDLYGRVTAGYLERMYGGISTELLWKPVDSRLGLGVEVNYVRQRDFDQRFGFRDYETATGHASAYYDFGNGFQGQVDVGRYLAKDWGGTISLGREFANGWKIGAFATFTDVSFDDFGEGSFDKGLTFEIPLEHFLGQPTRQTYSTTLRPLTRDGGARLNVKNRLYEEVREYHQPELRDTWGRFWR